MPKLSARITTKPHYILHPARAARRAAYRFTSGAQTGAEIVMLPWGLPLQIQRADAIGYSILVGRVFDPGVTETLFRLIAPGDTVVDAGANIGYLTSLAALRAGAEGSVLAFEPHPVVFAALEANVGRWAGAPVAPVEARRCALSDAPGRGELAVSSEFHLNMGLASLSPDQAGEDTVDVELVTLDQALGDRSVAVMKVDVEGHEPELFAGAQRVLAARQIRDIVYEDHEPYPSRASGMLERAGYRIFAIDNDLKGVLLLAPEHHHDAPAWPGPSYLASCEPERVLAHMQPRWWRVPGILPFGLERMLGRAAAR